MSVVLRRTVCGNIISCGDIEFRFDNLCGSHYQSLVNCESTVDVLVSGRWGDWSTNSRCYSVVCQLSRDVVGCVDCKTLLVRFDPSFVSQISVDPLLVKLVGLSIVCV